MNADPNPYATPASLAAPPVLRECCRRGHALIVPLGCEDKLPAGTCIQCGEPATFRLVRRMRTLAPVCWIAFFICLVMFPVFVFSGYAVAGVAVLGVVLAAGLRGMTLTVGLCERHRRRRRNRVLAAWLFFIAGAMLIISAFLLRHTDQKIWLGAGGVGAVGIGLVAVWRVSCQPIHLERIRQQCGIFSGPSDSWLAQLPEA